MTRRKTTHFVPVAYARFVAVESAALCTCCIVSVRALSTRQGCMLLLCLLLVQSAWSDIFVGGREHQWFGYLPREVLLKLFLAARKNSVRHSWTSAEFFGLSTCHTWTISWLSSRLLSSSAIGCPMWPLLRWLQKVLSIGSTLRAAPLTMGPWSMLLWIISKAQCTGCICE